MPKSSSHTRASTQKTFTSATKLWYKCPIACSATQVKIVAEDRVDDTPSISEGEKRVTLPGKEPSNSVNGKCNSHWATSKPRPAVPEGRDFGKISRAKVELRLLNEGKSQSMSTENPSERGDEGFSVRCREIAPVQITPTTCLKVLARSNT